MKRLLTTIVALSISIAVKAGELEKLKAGLFEISIPKTITVSVPKASDAGRSEPKAAKTNSENIYSRNSIIYRADNTWSHPEKGEAIKIIEDKIIYRADNTWSHPEKGEAIAIVEGNILYRADNTWAHPEKGEAIEIIEANIIYRADNTWAHPEKGEAIAIVEDDIIYRADNTWAHPEKGEAIALVSSSDDSKGKRL